MCGRARILPDGNLSTVSSDEVCLNDILKYERIDNDDYALKAKSRCVISIEVSEVVNHSLTNEMMIILQGIYNLTEDNYLTHFCLLVEECVTYLALPKTHKQAMVKIKGS